MEIYTIGFGKKKAKDFFEKLKEADIKTLIDVRLNNTSQLAGYTKRDDLKYFLSELCSAQYLHKPELAPTKEILDNYKKHGGSWDDYERDFILLMKGRKIDTLLDKRLFDNPTVLLCSEPEPDYCHRRLVAEYLKEKWGKININHL